MRVINCRLTTDLQIYHGICTMTINGIQTQVSVEVFGIKSRNRQSISIAGLNTTGGLKHISIPCTKWITHCFPHHKENSTFPWNNGLPDFLGQCEHSISTSSSLSSLLSTSASSSPVKHHQSLTLIGSIYLLFGINFPSLFITLMKMSRLRNHIIHHSDCASHSFFDHLLPPSTTSHSHNVWI